jgi:mono/diheme cytochrome c family protein
LALLLVLVLGQRPPATINTPAAGAVTWTNTFGPLFAQNCVVCHGGSSGLSLDTYDNAVKGGGRGPAITPGDGKGSLLVRALRGAVPGLPRMPLSRPPLPGDVIDGISAWIDAGAPR